MSFLLTKLGILIVVLLRSFYLRVCTWWAQVTKLHEAKTEKSEKAGSHWESNPGHLWLELPVLEVS